MKQKWVWICGGCMLLMGVALLRGTKRVESPAMPQAVIEQIPLPAPQAEAIVPSASPAETEKEAPDGGGYFVLKAYMEKLAVYRVYGDGTRAIASIIDTDIRRLPPQDVAQLEDGIVLRSEEALTRILEDFMS